MNHREPTGLLDLGATCDQTRRNLIHQLNVNGEMLARLPFEGIRTMTALRAALSVKGV